MQDRRAAPLIAAVVAIPLLLFGALQGSYYALLESQDHVFKTDNELVAVPIYRSDSRVVKLLLSPAHQVDRVLRPNHWATLVIEEE